MGSNLGISIDVPTAAINALQRAMDREGREFGKSVRSQVKIAAWSIGSTLGKATRVAKPAVELVKLNQMEARLLSIEKNTGKSAFIGTKYFGGKARQITVYAKGIRKARNDIRAKIYGFGLAKLSWRASISGLGSLGGMNVSKVDAKTIMAARKEAAVERTLTGNNPSILIGSYLPYAQDALIGGNAAIAPAIDRAARHMEHIMDAKAEKLIREMANA